MKAPYPPGKNAIRFGHEALTRRYATMSTSAVRMPTFEQ